MADLASHDLLIHLGTGAPAPRGDMAGEPVRLAGGEVSIDSLSDSAEEVPIGSLLPADSPRFGLPDPEHALVLAPVSRAESE